MFDAVWVLEVKGMRKVGMEASCLLAHTRACRLVDKEVQKPADKEADPFGSTDKAPVATAPE